MNTQIVKAEKTGRKRYAERERRKLLRKDGRSGMTQAAFCRANGVNAVTLSLGPSKSGSLSLSKEHRMAL
ncbi:MAG TPA: hypothetical protein P5026_06680 [Kiritimatiellia bacterium]|nr:hypothetical protein [Kiritimatiellia bacterium]HRU70073.1 hypothetical protein [Kiritimatiellia bacterium]